MLADQARHETRVVQEGRGSYLERANTPKAVVVATDGSITSLLHLAVEKGTPVAELKELVALHEHMEKRAAVKAFAEAMAAFQRECPLIKKSSTATVATSSGGSYSYTYAELDEIARTTGPVLAKHGLSYSWDTVVDAKMLACTCIVRHIAGHSVESKFSIPTEAASRGMSAQQAMGAALTYAKRQSMVAALGLTMTDKDTDAADPTPITEDQATTLLDLVKETGANHTRFLEALNAVSVTTIRAVDYKKAERMLREFARKKAQS